MVRRYTLYRVKGMSAWQQLRQRKRGETEKEESEEGAEDGRKNQKIDEKRDVGWLGTGNARKEEHESNLGEVVFFRGCPEGTLVGWAGKHCFGGGNASRVTKSIFYFIYYFYSLVIEGVVMCHSRKPGLGRRNIPVHPLDSRSRLIFC